MGLLEKLSLVLIILSAALLQVSSMAIVRRDISMDGRCGKEFGECPKGFCCSYMGWCGDSDLHCKIDEGCQSEFGECYGSVQVPKQLNEQEGLPISINGQCGAGIAVCPGTYCCSHWGWCGKTEFHCEIDNGCQSEFGYCNSETNAVTIAEEEIESNSDEADNDNSGDNTSGNNNNNTSSGKSSGKSNNTSGGKSSGKSNNTSGGKSSGKSNNTSGGKSSGKSNNTSGGKSSGKSNSTSGGKSSGKSNNTSSGKSSGKSNNTSGGKSSGKSNSTSGGKSSGKSNNTSGGKSSGKSNSTSGGKTKLEKTVETIYYFIKKNVKNATNNGIAAVIGNWKVESGINPKRAEGDYLNPPIGKDKAGKCYDDMKWVNMSGPQIYNGKYNNIVHRGIGLGQWTDTQGKYKTTRHTKLLNYASKKGKKWYDLNLQLEFMLYGDDQYNRNKLKEVLTSKDSVDNLTKQFLNKWEGQSNDDKLSKRRKAAREWLNYINKL